MDYETVGMLELSHVGLTSSGVFTSISAKDGRQ